MFDKSCPVICSWAPVILAWSRCCGYPATCKITKSPWSTAFPLTFINLILFILVAMSDFYELWLLLQQYPAESKPVIYYTGSTVAGMEGGGPDPCTSCTGGEHGPCSFPRWRLGYLYRWRQHIFTAVRGGHRQDQCPGALHLALPPLCSSFLQQGVICYLAPPACLSTMNTSLQETLPFISCICFLLSSLVTTTLSQWQNNIPMAFPQQPRARQLHQV